MATQLTADDARQSLQDHAATKGAEIFQKYGPDIGWGQILRMLEDRTAVRYPCKVVFDAESLELGEFAFAQSNGDSPEDGYTLFLHPQLANQPEDAVYAALYQLVVINYGPFASSEDAEAFGAAALNIPIEEYYNRLCAIADGLNS